MPQIEENLGVIIEEQKHGTSTITRSSCINELFKMGFKNY